MAENIDSLNFKMTDEEMAQIASLDKKESQFFDHRDPAMVEQILSLSRDV